MLEAVFYFLIFFNLKILTKNTPPIIKIATTKIKIKASLSDQIHPQTL
jgi:hypothetical protein